MEPLVVRPRDLSSHRPQFLDEISSPLLTTLRSNLPFLPLFLYLTLVQPRISFIKSSTKITPEDKSLGSKSIRHGPISPCREWIWNKKDKRRSQTHREVHLFSLGTSLWTPPTQVRDILLCARRQGPERMWFLSNLEQNCSWGEYYQNIRGRHHQPPTSTT